MVHNDGSNNSGMDTINHYHHHDNSGMGRMVSFNHDTDDTLHYHCLYHCHLLHYCVFYSGDHYYADGEYSDDHYDWHGSTFHRHGCDHRDRLPSG